MKAAIADYGVVLTGGLDDDSLSHDAATTNAARGARPGPAAGDFFDSGHGYVRLPGGASYAGSRVTDQSGTPFDVDVVGS